MKSQKKIMRFLGILFFWIGILLGMALAGGAVWADIEATFYGFEEMGDKSLSLRCPTFVTDAEPGQFASTFKNPNDKQMELMVRTDVSGHGGIRTERTTVTLAPARKGKGSLVGNFRGCGSGVLYLCQSVKLPCLSTPLSRIDVWHVVHQNDCAHRQPDLCPLCCDQSVEHGSRVGFVAG